MTSHSRVRVLAAAVILSGGGLLGASSPAKAMPGGQCYEDACTAVSTLCSILGYSSTNYRLGDYYCGLAPV